MRAEPAFGAAVRLLVPTTREAQIWVFCGTWDGRRWGLLLPAWLCPSPGRGGTWLWFRCGCCRARPGDRSDQVFLRRA
jgi:hypothetical protein